MAELFDGDQAQEMLNQYSEIDSKKAVGIAVGAHELRVLDASPELELTNDEINPIIEQTEDFLHCYGFDVPDSIVVTALINEYSKDRFYDHVSIDTAHARFGARLGALYEVSTSTCLISENSQAPSSSKQADLDQPTAFPLMTPKIS